MQDLTDLHLLPGKDEKSAPFLRAYEAGLEDDAQEFGYLEKDEAAAEDVVEPTRNEAEEDEDGEEQEVDEERHISMSELISQARKVAQGETVSSTQSDMQTLLLLCF